MNLTSRTATFYVAILAAEAMGLATRSAAATYRPVLIVFDFESAFDNGKMGKWAANNVRQKGLRRREYEIIEDLSFRDALAACGFKPSFDKPPKKFVHVARDIFAGDVVVWGKIESLGKDRYKLYVRAVNIRKNPNVLAVDKTYECDSPRIVPLSIKEALDKISGIQVASTEEVEDDSWKHRPNLVKNPGFEIGGVTPANWEPVNGLTTFWVDGVSPTGKCLMIDTNVPLEQYDEWMAKFHAGAPASAAPKKGKAGKYATVAASKGSHVYSDPIPVKPGMTYRFDIDVKGPSGNCKIFIKGYAQIKEKKFGAQDREIYRAPMTLRTRTKGREWEHWSRKFHPTQALAVFDFESDFDGGKLGRRTAEAIRTLAAGTGKFPTIPTRTVRAIVDAKKFRATYDMPIPDIQRFCRLNMGAGLTVWGKITREKGRYLVHVKASDFRKKQTRPFLHDVFEVADRNRIPSVCGKIVHAMMDRGVPVVKYLRIKIDAYWPPGTYYFDNVCLTEEGMHEYVKR